MPANESTDPVKIARISAASGIVQSFCGREPGEKYARLFEAANNFLISEFNEGQTIEQQ